MPVSVIINQLKNKSFLKRRKAQAKRKLPIYGCEMKILPGAPVD